MKDMRSLRKADIPAVGAALVWTGVFLAALLAIFCLEGAPTVAHLKAGQTASAMTEAEKTKEMDKICETTVFRRADVNP